MMNTLLWVIQGMLASVFLMTGTMKIIKKKEDLADQMGFVEDFSQQQVKGIGVLEILGALGVILPWATGILTWLTPLAALGLGLTMAGAFLTHLRRKELIPMGIVNIVLFSLAIFTSYGRFYL
ncbi:MAG: DoxX family protein [Anaerolineales bacterium]